MSKIKLDNPQAYPSFDGGDKYGNDRKYFKGISLRDYFAGQVVTSAASEFYNFVRNDSDYENMANVAYKLADAMLRERMKS